MAYDHITMERVCMATGSPMPSDIETMIQWLFNETTDKCYELIANMQVERGVALADLVQLLGPWVGRLQMEPAVSRLPEQFRSGASEEGGGDKSRAREKLREERATRVLEHVARIVNNHSDNPTATFQILSEFWRVRSDTRPVEERPMAKNITIASHPGKTWAGGLRKKYSYAGKLFLKEPEGPTWTADDARLVSATSNTPLTVGEVKLLALLSAGAAKLATPPEPTNPANTLPSDYGCH